MIEVHPGLFLGNRHDYEKIVAGQSGWAVVHACRTYHRMVVGYRIRNVPVSHPDYLIARRENRIMLSLDDLPIATFIRKEMIDETLDFIDQMRNDGFNVLIHCMQGRSRSPSITMLYLATRLHVLPDSSLEAAERQFRHIYPRYAPNRGIREHLRRNWHLYRADRMTSG